jgi:serine/threonine protein kinase KIN1/2
VSAIIYIHSNNIVHRDLKLENILLKEKGNPYSLKIIDFGISGVLTKVGGEIIQAGTMMYSPPEVINKTQLQSNPKIDVWSLGNSKLIFRSDSLYYSYQRISVLRKIMSTILSRAFLKID